MVSHFVWLNRSKESLTLDLKHPQARQIIHQLLEDADVFMQNLAPGAAERLGLGPEVLAQHYPRLIVCGVSGYGASGPYRDKKAYDLLVQGETGLVSVTGTPETPAKVGISIADIAAGMYAFTGILTALYQRERTGKGTVLEVSMFEALHASIDAVFSQLTIEQVVTRLDWAQIANARMNTMQEFWEHPQLQARERWREVDSPVGQLQALLPPVTMRDVEPRMDPIPALGEQTEQI